MRRTKRHRKRSSKKNFRKKLTKKQEGGYDIYQALNIPRNATKDEAKKAWRKHISTYHTDKGATGDKDKFNMVQQAWNLFKNNGRKQLYDDNLELEGPVAAFNIAMGRGQSESITKGVGNWHGPADDDNSSANNQQQQQQAAAAAAEQTRQAEEDAWSKLRKAEEARQTEEARREKERLFRDLPRVRIHGIMKRKELNGREGVITGKATGVGRYNVDLDGEVVSIKLDNLEYVGPNNAPPPQQPGDAAYANANAEEWDHLRQKNKGSFSHSESEINCDGDGSWENALSTLDQIFGNTYSEKRQRQAKELINNKLIPWLRACKSSKAYKRKEAAFSEYKKKYNNYKTPAHDESGSGAAASSNSTASNCNKEEIYNSVNRNSGTGGTNVEENKKFNLDSYYYASENARQKLPQIPGDGGRSLFDLHLSQATTIQGNLLLAIINQFLKWEKMKRTPSDPHAAIYNCSIDDLISILVDALDNYATQGISTQIINPIKNQIQISKKRGYDPTEYDRQVNGLLDQAKSEQNKERKLLKYIEVLSYSYRFIRDLLDGPIVKNPRDLVLPGNGYQDDSLSISAYIRQLRGLRGGRRKRKSKKSKTKRSKAKKSKTKKSKTKKSKAKKSKTKKSKAKKSKVKRSKARKSRK